MKDLDKIDFEKLLENSDDIKKEEKKKKTKKETEEVKFEDIVIKEAPKKRGRPRKVKIEEKEETIPAVPKKRGRPKKVKVETPIDTHIIVNKKDVVKEAEEVKEEENESTIFIKLKSKEEVEEEKRIKELKQEIDVVKKQREKVVSEIKEEKEKQIELKPVKSAEEINVAVSEKELERKKEEENKQTKERIISNYEHTIRLDTIPDELLKAAEREVKEKEEIYLQKRTIPKEVKVNIFKKILMSYIVPIIFLLILWLMSSFKGIWANFIWIIGGILSVLLYEVSYKKSNAEYFFMGVETNILSYFVYIITNYKRGMLAGIKTDLIYMIWGGIYILKTIYIYLYEKRKYLQSQMDIKEITKDRREKYV